MRRIAIIVLFLSTGILLAGGLWLIWDWAHLLIRGGWFDTPKFNREWVFPAPFYLFTWYADRWSEPFDVGAAMIVAAFLLMSVCAYKIGEWHARAT